MKRISELVVAAVTGAVLTHMMTASIGAANADQSQCGVRIDRPCFVAIVQDESGEGREFDYFFDPNQSP